MDKISPVITTPIVEDLQISLIEMFGNSPRSKEEIDRLGAYIFGSKAQQYYAAKIEAGSFTLAESHQLEEPQKRVA